MPSYLPSACFVSHVGLAILQTRLYTHTHTRKSRHQERCGPQTRGALSALAGRVLSNLRIILASPGSASQGKTSLAPVAGRQPTTFLKAALLFYVEAAKSPQAKNINICGLRFGHGTIRRIHSSNANTLHLDAPPLQLWFQLSLIGANWYDSREAARWSEAYVHAYLGIQSDQPCRRRLVRERQQTKATKLTDRRKPATQAPSRYT